MQDVKVPADLKPGESYTFVINELTQETMTVTCCEAPETYSDVMLVSDSGGEYYYWAGGEAGEEVYLEHDSADYEQKIVGKGIIRLKKDVIIGEVNIYRYENFHPSRQMIGYLTDSWYNESVFDEDGCITWLCFYGD